MENEIRRRQRVEVRFAPAPHCWCRVRATMRSVEDPGKASYGKVYYSCRVCRFFEWGIPRDLVWAHNGLPVDPPDVNFERSQSMGNNFPAELEEIGEVSSPMTYGRKDVVEPRFWKEVAEPLFWKVFSGFLLAMVVCLLIFK